MRRVILLLLLLGVSGWLGLRHYRQQKRLYQQLEQLTAVLTSENDRVAKEAKNAVKGIEAKVDKNNNQSADVALLRHAEELQTQANQLIATLRAYSTQLRLSTDNPAAPAPLQQPGTAVGPVLGAGTTRRQLFQQQLDTYATTLHHLSLAEAAPLTGLTFEANTPVAEALADLCQLENTVLVRQTRSLQRLAKAVRVQEWLTHLLITATAESSVVAPGDTYRAQLRLVGYFSAAELKMVMTCNGQPVSAGPDGTGLVRFRAPTLPGPATWTGTIRINQYGRDTTFKVTVPYRVARH